MTWGRSGRVRAYHLGRFAEHLCKWILRLKSYRIIEAGYRTKVGEIDMLATRGG
jgi:putative endonuclease